MFTAGRKSATRASTPCSSQQVAIGRSTYDPDSSSTHQSRRRNWRWSSRCQLRDVRHETAAARPGESQGGPELFPPLKAASDDLLALPPGFEYEVVAKAGATSIHDGSGTIIGKTPDRADGTGVFKAEKGYRLVQNHELSPGATLSVPQVPSTVYDSGVTGGGCTVVEVSHSGRRRSEWVGDLRYGQQLRGRCDAMGEAGCHVRRPRSRRAASSRASNWPLIMDSSLMCSHKPSAQLPKPIKAWSRFAHEAVCRCA